MAGRSASLLSLSLVLALAPMSATAQDRAAKPPLFPAMPTLVFPSLALPGANGHSDDAREFRATALRDLKDSGAFHLTSPARTPGGADLMFRFVSHSLARGKLIIEGECINLATGAVVLKKRFMGQTAVVDRMAHRMVDFLVGTVTGTPGVADSSVVFARATAPGIKEIYGVDRDGRNLRQLTRFGSLTIHPAVSRDGRLAFVTYKGGPPQIWGQQKPSGPFQLLYPKAGEAGRELSDLAWSADGRRLCFVQETRQGLADIQVLDPASGKAARITDGHTDRSPCWNPDGTALAFISDREGVPQVFTMASDGSQPRRLTGDPAPKACVAWSPKGDRIAFTAGADLCTIAPDGSARQKLLSSAAPVAALCWAPDGRSLLLGLPDGHLRIATLDGKLQELGPGLEGGQWPQWVQNPAPVLARAQGEPYPVPGLLGTAPLP
jgi:TolB protein